MFWLKGGSKKIINNNIVLNLLTCIAQLLIKFAIAHFNVKIRLNLNTNAMIEKMAS